MHELTGCVVHAIKIIAAHSPPLTKEMAMKDQSILTIIPSKNDYAFVTNKESSLPIAAILNNGTIVTGYLDAANELFDVGLITSDTIVSNIIPAAIETHTTTKSGNHGNHVIYPGESLGQWIHKIEATLLEEKIVSLILRHHSGSDGEDYQYEMVDIAPIDYEKMRRRVRDALNKTASRESIVKCALALNVEIY